MEKQIKNYNGEMFTFRVSPKEEISILEVGYAINLDGEFIPVKDNEFHADVFSSYINAYLGQENSHILNEILNIPEGGVRPTLDSLEAGLVLTKLNHVVYYGLRPSDIQTTYNTDDNAGFCLIILPDNYKETLTPEQKESLLELIATNRSVFGNHEKVSLYVHIFRDENEINMQEFIETLSNGRSK